ncbi:hypothetical protein FA13DRAFT_1801724 [Coprinellus micaceus]|uniref:Uncharacterized protein n=1 Tax=Coprinellus micaceus TaxID=71717 RepID=A0A4Y7SDH6_COPMI|nr:hypothetical protein FA13DRAFT_1801724 [Coprinellus micaceus]
MSIYKHPLDRQLGRAPQPSPRELLHSPSRRLDRPPPTSRTSTGPSLASPSSHLPVNASQLSELHGNAVEERRARLSIAAKGGRVPMCSKLATVVLDATDVQEVVTEGAFVVDATVRPLHGEPLEDGSDATLGKRRRDVSVSSESSLSSLSGLSSLSEDEDEAVAEPVQKRVKVGHEHDGAGGEEGDEGDEEGEGAAILVVGRLLDRVEGESEDEGEDEDRGEDEENSEEDVREENDDENENENETRIEEEDSEDDCTSEDSSSSSDDDSDYASPPSSTRAAPRRMRVPSPKGAYRMPMSMRLQQRMVLGSSGGGGGKSEDIVERRKGAALKTPKKKVNSESGSRGRGGTLPCPTTPKTPPFRGVIPTSTRLQEQRLKALEQEGTPSNHVHWQKTPLSMRLQERMLRKREEEGGAASSASPSGRRGASGPAAPLVYRESSPKGLPLPIPVAVVDTAEVQEDSDKESENKPGSAVESGGDSEGDDDDADSEAADADRASGATVDVGRAWLSGAKATRSTGRAVKDIMGYGSDVGEEEGGDDKDGDMEEAEASASLSRDSLLIAPVVGERDKDDVTVGPTERRESQLLATPILPWDDVQGPIGLVSAADAGPDLGEENLDTREDAQEIDNQVVARIPECNTPVQNRRSSARLAGIHAQRGPLPSALPSTPASASRARVPPTTNLRTKSTKARQTPKRKAPKGDVHVPVPFSANHPNPTAPTMTPSRIPKPRPKFRIVEELEEVKRARLAYPEPATQASQRARYASQSEERDWNERNPVDWETSLGRRVAARIQEMGMGVRVWESNLGKGDRWREVE